MAQRPTFIDLGAGLDHTKETTISSPNGLSSPRITHIAGDVPPAMSPLDALAAQSRLLSKELDDSRRNGRRVSRLPPLTVAKSLAKPRQGFFRSISSGPGGHAEDQTVAAQDEACGNKMEVEEPTFRPKSFYPRMGRMPMGANGNSPLSSPALNDQTFSTPLENHSKAVNDYFGAVRAYSPDSMAPSRQSVEVTSPLGRYRQSAEASHSHESLHRGLSVESTSSRSHHPDTLGPPTPHYAQKTPSIRSIPIDSSDDEYTGYTGSSGSRDRGLSSSSAISLPQSPLSPFGQSHGRPPSVNSEYSIGGTPITRPTFNFSRPLSHSSRPSMEFPSRKPLTDSQAQVFGDQAVHTPMSMDSEEYFDSKEHQPAPAPSYIYAKFSLPRGRMLERDSSVLENTEMPQFEWNQPLIQTNVVVATPPAEREADSSPSTLPHSIQSNDIRPVTPERLFIDHTESANVRPPPIPTSDDRYRYSMTSTNSGSTIKPSTPRTLAKSVELTAEDHLTKGIDCHERGSFKESTYHLRIAARQDNPIAMLLYALACRHGWGMRQSPEEGVRWLRKAMDLASIELEEDVSDNRGRNSKDVQDQKAHRARFALSVYELGVSHMNGWGTEQDKALALRCFEIAADWGDADAMAEAGFCYAQGVGCKKDLKKAAKYYRTAEARGMSMVGNSWYVSKINFVL